MSTKFHYFAIDIMFGGVCHPSKHGLIFRKNKTMIDVNAALKKAGNPKNGHSKTEMELSMLEVYLQGIFKDKPKGKSNAAGS